MLARSKLNSIETLTSESLIYYEISHEEQQKIINEEEKYRKMKENVIMMKRQRCDAEKDELNEGYKRNEINEINIENNENA